MASPGATESVASRVAARRQERALARKDGRTDWTKGLRDELGEVRDQIMEAYYTRVQRENQIHRERLANMKATIDDDTEDDATGEARARLRVESQKKRLTELKALHAENAKYFAFIRSATAVTDSKIWDDGTAASMGRGTMAAQSRARRKAEAEELARENAELRARLKQVKSVTDDDVDDDHAGEMRAKMAAEAKARRKAEADALKKRNEEMQARLKNVKAVTDDDVMDEEAGAQRAVMADASKTRKAAEAKKLDAENDAMDKRIDAVVAKTDDGDGIQF